MRTLSSHCLLSLLLLAPAVSAHAQMACPWLTQGTAEAWLQGPATLSTQPHSANAGTCTFTTLHYEATFTLTITVAPTNDFYCPGATRPLTGIGNQATLCSTNALRNQTIDSINSLVRDRYLTVKLTIVSKQASPLAPDKRQALLQQIAEEVAGNLY